MSKAERDAVRDAIEAAATITAETGDDPAYLEGQRRIREAEQQAGRIQSALARALT